MSVKYQMTFYLKQLYFDYDVFSDQDQFVPLPLNPIFDKYQKLGPLNPDSFILKQIMVNEKRDYLINELQIEEKERKPMIEIEAYQKKWGKK